MAAAFAPLAGARATTLKAISGDEQIRQADEIFLGRADRIDMARDWTKPGAPIVSTVRFTPVAIYKGKVATPTSLDFLGGTAEGLRMKVDGMPAFEVGQEYVLFVSGTKNRACPIVGWTAGSLKVDRQANAAGAVAISNTTADWLRQTSIARGRAVMPATLDLAQFESLLRTRITQVGKSK